jgi:hypothetical protein
LPIARGRLLIAHRTLGARKAAHVTAVAAELRDDVDLIIAVLDEAYEILQDNARRERYRRALAADPSETAQAVIGGVTGLLQSLVPSGSGGLLEAESSVVAGPLQEVGMSWVISDSPVVILGIANFGVS